MSILLVSPTSRMPPSPLPDLRSLHTHRRAREVTGSSFVASTAV